MAYPKKKKGFRNITVNDIVYRWRVGFDPHSVSDTLTLRGPKSSRQNLEFRFKCDLIWEQWECNDGTIDTVGFPVRPPDHPKAITPRLVRQAILYGLEHGWNPNEYNKIIYIDWQKNMLDEPSPLEFKSLDDEK